MLNKIVNILKEVFWLKPSRKKAKSLRSPHRKKVRKPAVKKKVVKKPIKKSTRVIASEAKVLMPDTRSSSQSFKRIASSSSTSRNDTSNLLEVGVITHYFDRIKVCVIKLTHGTILTGDKLTIIGLKSRFVQKVWSMQIESVDVKVAKKGQIIGLKIDKVPAVGDKVYKAQ